jgi:Cellulose biosynthesis protein BcsS
VRARAQRGRCGMRRCAVLALWLGFAAPAAATDDKAREEARTVLFGGLDVGRSVFVSAGRKQTLGAFLDESGPVFMLTAASGRKRERDSVLGSMTVRQAAEASALLGYQWVFGRTIAAAFVGPELDVETGHWLSFAHPDDRARAGARVLGEVWSHPREDLLLHATTIAGSSRGHVWSRLAAGLRAWRNVYVGPEAALYRTATYHEGRLGLHATGVEFGSFAVRVSGGWRWDQERDRSGPYVGLSGHWRP